MAAQETDLWARANRVVLARVKKVRSIRLRGSEEQWFDSPLVALRPIEWLKGRGSIRGLSVHFLSDDSCDEGGGDAPHGSVGEEFLLFYGPGQFDPRDLLGSIRKDRVVTTRSREAIAQAPRKRPG
jgi:hypothetical protein